MTQIGFAVIAHDNVFRLRQVVSYLARQNLPIALHLDSKTAPHVREALEFFFKDYRRLYWVESLHCDWGQWSIVEAQIRAVKLLMKKEPELDYVYNISGSCLPLRPIEELADFLGASQFPHDYIESVAIGDEQWVYDGLNQERLELYHPFNWRRHRKLFDYNVKLQRLFKYRRKIPSDLTPSFGSQWWCLSTPTLKRIFEDEKFDAYCKFFSKSWIPDESFFQTLARKHSSRIESRSLTYATFDNMGKPFLLYDDHIQILDRLDTFFIRKAWRGADKLYSHFLNPDREILKRDPYAALELQALQEYARNTSVQGRVGLLSQFRFPKSGKNIETRAPYYIYVGFHEVRQQIYDQYFQSETIEQMGYLFHPNRTETELTQHKTPRNQKDLFHFRDYHRLQFLTQRIWSSFPKNIAFLAKPHHLKKMTDAMSRDSNCHVLFVRGAWLIDLYHRKIQNVDRLRTVSQIELRREAKFIEVLEKNPAAKIESFDVSQLLLDPESIATKFPEQLTLASPEIDMDDFRQFINSLINNGISLKNYDTIRIMREDENPNIASDDQVISMADYFKVKRG